MNPETKTDLKRFSVEQIGKTQIRDKENSVESTPLLGTDRVKQCNENEDEQRITHLSDGTVESLKMIEPPTGGYTEEWKSHIKCTLHLFSFV